MSFLNFYCSIAFNCPLPYTIHIQGAVNYIIRVGNTKFVCGLILHLKSTFDFILSGGVKMSFVFRKRIFEIVATTIANANANANLTFSIQKISSLIDKEKGVD